MNQVLIVDDDSGVRTTLSEALRSGGYAVRAAASGHELMKLVEHEPADLVILDMVLPGADGLQVLQDLSRQQPGLPVVMITGHASVSSAIAAMKMGALDYIVKPFRIEEIQRVVQNSLERARMRRDSAVAGSDATARGEFQPILGHSPAMQRVTELVERIAPTRSTVLICGASGTGKELIARAIHARSERSRGPFIGVNCGALPDALLEDELFGHLRGAFTDAVSDRQGRFEQAGGGTLFLDEIGTMSPSLQVKLLRVLQEREFMPLGSTRRVHVDVRILAATNQDIRRSVECKEFREDLYYRLNVIQITLPPLSERPEDIPLLARHFLNKLSVEVGTPARRFSREAMHALCSYDWPGNVRQLENVVERCLALAPDNGDLGLADLPDEIAGTRGVALPPVPQRDGAFDLDRLVRDFEEQMIYRALQDTGWVKTRAASRLSIKRTTLIEKMKRLGIPLRTRPEPDQA